MSVAIPDALLKGYAAFRSGRYADEANRYRLLAEGQSPETMIIGCADSRVDPATIFGAAPGELFVVRNVAALVPPFETDGVYHGTSAALEFAVTKLNVKRIVVLGHAMCGGVAAALSRSEDRPVGRFIDPWVDQLVGMSRKLSESGCCEDEASRQREMENLGVKYSIQNLETFGFVTDAIEAGNLEIYGAWFSIAEGELYWLDRETGGFERVQT